MTDAEKLFAWQTTSPHPWKRSHTHGADQGQVGWKLHAVPMRRYETTGDIKNRRALCGRQAKHGWGLDLFIDDPCKRCDAMVKTLGMRELAEVITEERELEMQAHDNERRAGWITWQDADRYYE